MKVLITGGAGFIGRKLTKELVAQGRKVRWLDVLDPQIHGNQPDFAELADGSVELIVGDVCDRESSPEKNRSAWLKAIEGVDTIYHFAAQTGTGQSMYRVAYYTDVNVGGTGLLWDVLANEKHDVKKVVIASSRSIYGEGAYQCSAKCGLVVPEPRTKAQLDQHLWDLRCPVCGAEATPVATTEASVPQPASLYACSKLAQEQMSITMGKALGISTIALRFQNVFGPGQSLSNPYTGIISIFSNQMRQNLPVNIYEDGEETRDFVYVGDVVNACLRAATIEQDAVILNVGSGVATKVIDLAGLLKKLWGSESTITVSGDSRVGDIRHNWADLSAVQQACVGWQPTPLAAGLQEFVDWAKSQAVFEDKSAIAAAELKKRNL
jgi:dTDP-L-rhamnose 4-epimerase